MEAVTVRTTAPAAPRTRALNLRTRATLLGLVETLGRIGAGLSTAFLLDALLTAPGPQTLRMAVLTVAAVLAAGAFDERFGPHLERAIARHIGTVHGGREYECPDCGTTIRADYWTRAAELRLVALLADRAAHGCTGRRP